MACPNLPAKELRAFKVRRFEFPAHFLVLNLSSSWQSFDQIKNSSWQSFLMEITLVGNHFSKNKSSSWQSSFKTICFSWQSFF